MPSESKKIVRVAAAMIVDGNRFLIAKRSGKRHLSGYWEFPGGKIEQGESPTVACIREVKEELDCDIIVSSYFLTTEYDYEDFILSMDLFICNFTEKVELIDLKLKEHDEYKFITVEEMDEINFAPADIAFLPNIKSFMQSLKSFNQTEQK